MKDDLINRQAAIDVIDAVFPVDPMKSEYAQGIACGAALAKTYVEQLPSAQQWIPCSERLPEVGQIVLICPDNRLVREATYKGINSQEETVWICHGNVLWDDDVLRWMPMPEPYKEEQT